MDDFDLIKQQIGFYIATLPPYTRDSSADRAEVERQLRELEEKVVLQRALTFAYIRLERSRSQLKTLQADSAKLPANHSFQANRSRDGGADSNHSENEPSQLLSERPADTQENTIENRSTHMPGVEYEATQPPPQSQALGVIHENSQRMLDGLRQGQHTPPGPSMAELKAKLAALQKESEILLEGLKAMMLNGLFDDDPEAHATMMALFPKED